MMVYMVVSYFSIEVFFNKMVLGRNVDMLLEVIVFRFKDNIEVFEMGEYVLKLQESLVKVYELVRNCLKQNVNY